MVKARDIANAHMDAALAEAELNNLSKDALARCFLSRVIEVYLSERTLADVASELQSAIEHLDPDEDFTFMRP